MATQANHVILKSFGRNRNRGAPIGRLVVRLLFQTDGARQVGLQPKTTLPFVILELLNDTDAARSRRTMEAMLQMIKLDIVKLECATDGR